MYTREVINPTERKRTERPFQMTKKFYVAFVTDEKKKKKKIEKKSMVKKKKKKEMTDEKFRRPEGRRVGIHNI